MGDADSLSRLKSILLQPTDWIVISFIKLESAF